MYVIHRLSLLLVLGTLLAACDDPSNVGIGLVDDNQGAPVIHTLESTDFTAVAQNDETGAASSVLAGRVDDPAFGMFSATGYIDFYGTNNQDASSVTGAVLQLAPSYTYGDTTATVTLNLYDLIETWTGVNAPADTTLPVGGLVTSFDVLPTDTLVSITLPESWVDANEMTLISDTFSLDFHGFALEPAAGNAVIGFDAGRSALQVFADTDTLTYPVTISLNAPRTLTHIEHVGEPVLPADRLLIHDGIGTAIRLDFDLAQDALQEAPLNGAFVRLHADTLALQQTPPNFARPLLEQLHLVAMKDDQQVGLLGEARLDASGRFVFDDPASAAAIRNVLQRTFFGEDLFTHFELRAPTGVNTLNPILLYDDGTGDTSPALVLTITPSGN